MTRQEFLKAAKPILFNTDMVRAILDSRKTATRRVCHIHIKINGNTPVNHKLCYTAEYPEINIDDLCANFYDKKHFYKGCAKQPCKVGDYLYVRETWGIYEQSYMDAIYILYRADFPNGAKTFGADGVSCDLPTWRPSIHMPKEAARIFLRVTDVRVERLQDMNMNDIQAEGVVPVNVTGGQYQQWQQEYMMPVWNSTVKKSDLDRYGWDVNPWVWVIEFERVEVDH